MSKDRATPRPSVVVASTRKRPGAPAGWRTIGADGGAGLHIDAVLGELLADEGTHGGVHRGEDLLLLFHLGHRQAPGDQRFGHLEPDVAGTHDERARRGGFLERRA